MPKNSTLTHMCIYALGNCVQGKLWMPVCCTLLLAFNVECIKYVCELVVVVVAFCNINSKTTKNSKCKSTCFLHFHCYFKHLAHGKKVRGKKDHVDMLQILQAGDRSNPLRQWFFRLDFRFFCRPNWMCFRIKNCENLELTSNVSIQMYSINYA